MIHRDLKPANVLVGDHGEVRVGDWGLAKVLGQEETGPDRFAIADPADGLVTRHGAIIGTPAYMAPELALGRHDEVDRRTDVYGLGAILFEVLTGRPPHADQAGPNVLEVIRRIGTDETPRARSIDPAIAPELDAICARAMARERSDRYPGAADLAADLRRALPAGP